MYQFEGGVEKAAATILPETRSLCATKLFVIIFIADVVVVVIALPFYINISKSYYNPQPKLAW